MPAILTFLKSPLGRWALSALIALAIVVGFYARGHHDGKASEQRAEASRLAQARKAVAKREAQASKITEKVGKDLAETKVRIEYRTKTLIERIPSAPDPSRGSLPNWFVRLHDSAVLGLPEAPGSASGPDNAPSGVTDPEALRVIIPNLGVCHEALARNAAWESFYGQLRAEYNR